MKPALLLLFSLISVAAGAVIGNARAEREAWGYVPVRSNASMFWWLYYANNPTKSYTALPLVMWLQGGPGGSGCGFGNFEEIGPLDIHLKPRNTTWKFLQSRVHPALEKLLLSKKKNMQVREASVLFVDNPVGTGFSYTNDSQAFAKDIDTVAADMLVFLQRFFNSHPEFQNIPFHIFSESYGGKMAAAVAFDLQKAITAGSIKCKFAGVALGDSWISPIDSVLSWGPYLYSTSLLDDEGLEQVTAKAKQVLKAINQGKYKQATDLFRETEDVIEENTDGVNFYNILTKDSPVAKHSFAAKDSVFANINLAKLYHRHVKRLQIDDLSGLMNGPIRKKLGIIPDFVTWGGQSADVFLNMAEDFMKPVIDIVDMLLAAKVNVTVYNGQLDLIVDTIGQEMWLKKLRWPHLDQFKSLKWKPLHVPSAPMETAAFYKSYENFAFYWIMRAGHMRFVYQTSNLRNQKWVYWCLTLTLLWLSDRMLPIHFDNPLSTVLYKFKRSHQIRVTWL